MRGSVVDSSGASGGGTASSNCQHKLPATSYQLPETQNTRVTRAFSIYKKYAKIIANGVYRYSTAASTHARRTVRRLLLNSARSRCSATKFFATSAEVSASSARAAAKNVRCSNRILIFKCQEAHHLIQGTQTRTVASRFVHRVFVFVVWITIYICRI